MTSDRESCETIDDQDLRTGTSRCPLEDSLPCVFRNKIHVGDVDDFRVEDEAVGYVGVAARMQSVLN